MNNVEIEKITSEILEDSLTGIIVDGVPHLYWKEIYQNLGIKRNHAYGIIKRLEKGKHFIEFSVSELKDIYIRVHKPCTLSPTSRYVFLTAEGYHRAIIEIQTGYMDDPLIIQEINRKKDHIAYVYTKYQRGELEQIETPVIKKIQEKRDIGTNLSKQIGRVVKEYLMPEYVRKGLNPHTAFSREHRAINTITNGKHEADLKNKLNSDGLDVQNAAKLLEVGFIEAGLYDDETRWGNTEKTINIVYPNRFNERIKLNEKELTLIKRGCTETQRSLGEFNPSQKRISGAV